MLSTPQDVSDVVSFFVIPNAQEIYAMINKATISQEDMNTVHVVLNAVHLKQLSRDDAMKHMMFALRQDPYVLFKYALYMKNDCEDCTMRGSNSRLSAHKTNALTN